MTHIRYVRSSAGRPFGAPVFRTLMSRVMPARLLMTGTLLIWSGLALSQQFLVAGCDSSCQPAVSTIPEDIMVDCLADLPAFDLPATEGCDGTPVANVPHVELNEDVITTYDLGTAYGPGIFPVPLNSSKITSSILEPVSINAVAIIVKDPPFSTFLAAPKNLFGL